MVGSLVSLAPSASFAALAATLLVSLVLTAAMTFLDLPVSFSMVMVGAFVGAALGSALPLNVYRASDVVVFWFPAPLGPLSSPMRSTAWLEGSPQTCASSGWTPSTGAGPLSAFAASYALGANNIGTFYGSPDSTSALGVWTEVFVLLAVAAMLGVAVLGRQALGGAVGTGSSLSAPRGCSLPSS